MGRKRGVVTERDRHACALVREARTLSAAQLVRLLLPGRSERAGRWLLRSLVDLGLLRREEWVGLEGLTSVYSVTPDGDSQAERVAPGGEALHHPAQLEVDLVGHGAHP